MLISVVPIVLAVAVTWWFGTRVLWKEGKRLCRCDLGKWLPEPDEESKVHRNEATARQFGIQLRNKALAHWKEESPKLFKARQGNRGLGMIVPPFSGVFAIFTVALGRVTPFWGLAIFFMGTAIPTIMGLLSLPSELTAVRRYIKSGHFKGAFPNSYDEESIIACALAQVWESGLPPILRWLQPK